MHTSTAFERRESLSDRDLDRLLAALKGEADQYRDAIRGYSPEKMARYGRPFLADLEERVAVVERLVKARASTD